MSSYFSDTRNVVDGISPREWIAITLAEYMEQSAVDTNARVAQQIIDQADENIDNWTASRLNQIEDLQGAFSTQLENAAVQAGIDLSTVDRTSQDFLTFASDVWVDAIAREELPTEWLDQLTDAERATLLSNPYEYTLAMSADDVLFVSQALRTELESEVTVVDGTDALINIGSGYVSELKMRRLTVATANLSPSEDAYKAALEVFDSAGNRISTITDSMYERLSPEAFIDYLSQSSGSCLAVAGALRAMAYDTISDRVSAFENYVESAGSGLISRAKGVTAAVRSKISDLQSDASDAIDYFMEVMGLSNIAQGSDLDDTEMMEYMGASPVPALDIHAAKTVATLVGVAVAGVAYGVWAAAKAAASKVGGWFKQLVTSAFVTTDVQTVDSPLRTKRGFADGWSWNYSAAINMNVGPLYYPEGGYDTVAAALTQLVSSMNSLLSSQGGMSFRSLFAEMVVIPTASASWLYETHDDEFAISIPCRVICKPACIDVEFLHNALRDNGFSDLMSLDPDDHYYLVNSSALVESQWTLQRFTALFAFLATLSGDTELYYQLKGADGAVDEDDTRVVMGWMCGLAMHQILCDAFGLYLDAQQNTSASGYVARAGTQSYYYSFPIPGYNGWCFSQVNNTGLVTASTGWNGNPTTPSFGSLSSFATSTMFTADFRQIFLKYLQGFVVGSRTVMIRPLTHVPAVIIAAMIDQRIDRVDNATDFLYLPFSQSVTVFSVPDYHIRSDSDNVKIATAFWLTVGTLAVTAIAGLSAKLITRSLTRKKFFKWTQIQGRLDNAMWNGHVLDRQEQRQYRKALKKLGRISIAEEIVDQSTRNAVTEAVETAKSAAARAVPLANAVLGTSFTTPISTTANNPDVTFEGVMGASDRIVKLIAGA